MSQRRRNRLERVCGRHWVWGRCLQRRSRALISGSLALRTELPPGLLWTLQFPQLQKCNCFSSLQAPLEVHQFKKDEEMIKRRAIISRFLFYLWGFILYEVFARRMAAVYFGRPTNWWRPVNWWIFMGFQRRPLDYSEHRKVIYRSSKKGLVIKALVKWPWALHLNKAVENLFTILEMQMLLLETTLTSYSVMDIVAHFIDGCKHYTVSFSLSDIISPQDICDHPNYPSHPYTHFCSVDRMMLKKITEFAIFKLRAFWSLLVHCAGRT